MKTVDVKQQTGAVALTRREKLLRWADLIQAENKMFYIFHKLERWNWNRLSTPMASQDIPDGYATAFGVAAADPVFRAAGLAGDSVANSMKFFELSQHDIHEFSCDCGGLVHKSTLVDRVQKIAERPESPGFGMRNFAASFMQIFQ